ncbi:TonB family protein [Mucilaginibacter sp. UYNi724]
MRSFFVSFFLLISSVCFAQRQNVYFFKDNGREVDVKDSADYIRVVSEPDSGSTLYNVIEYYANGKKKRIGRSKEIEYNSFSGISMSFYKNGTRKTTETFIDGWPYGDYYEYYPNGSLYTHKDIITRDKKAPGASFPDKVTTERIIEAFDSLGTVKVKDDNGELALYSDNFTEIIEQGPIVNGSKNGIWKGTDKQSNATFEEDYNNGKLISGKAVVNGVNTTYDVRRVSPTFPGGENKFGYFLGTNIKYPATERERKIQGRVVLNFMVEKNGKLTNFIILRSPSHGLGAESLRVLQLSPNWIPGLMYGVPARISYSMPVNFTLANE